MSAPAAPRVSATSLPVATQAPAGSSPPAGDAASPVKKPRKPRQPRAPKQAAAPGAPTRPDTEALAELGGILWDAVVGSGSLEEGFQAVASKLKAAKRLGQLATLLGVD